MTEICDSADPLPDIIEVLVQGPPGPPGDGNPGDYLQTALRLAEFSTPESRAAARANLELQAIDCGTFN